MFTAGVLQQQALLSLQTQQPLDEFSTYFLMLFPKRIDFSGHTGPLELHSVTGGTTQTTTLFRTQDFKGEKRKKARRPIHSYCSYSLLPSLSQLFLVLPPDILLPPKGHCRAPPSRGTLFLVLRLP